MVCCERKNLFLFQSGSWCYKSNLFLLLGLYFFISSTSIHQTSNVVVNLSPECLVFWIQNFVLDHCVPEKGFVFDCVKAGL